MASERNDLCRFRIEITEFGSKLVMDFVYYRPVHSAVD